VDHSTQLPIGDSASNNDPQEPFAGETVMVSDSPSPRNVVSPSPSSTPQTSSQLANRSSEPVSPGSDGGSAGADDGKNERPDATSSVMLQDTPPDADRDRPEPNTLENGLGGSGMLLVSIPPTRILQWWRLGPECRRRIPRR